MNVPPPPSVIEIIRCSKFEQQHQQISLRVANDHTFSVCLPSLPPLMIQDDELTCPPPKKERKFII